MPHSVGYCFATQDRREGFVAFTDPWLGEDMETPSDDLDTGYLLRDGEYAPLVKGFRTTTLAPDTKFIETIHLEAVDTRGRDLVADGKVKLTGLKAEQKVYRHYTGFPGGLREEEFTKRLARRPDLVVQDAIEGMLPKTKLGRAMAKKLKVYKGDKHPHMAQKPETMAASQ